MYEIKIGQVIKRLLKERHETLKDVSRKTGLSYSTLFTWQENRQPKDILKAHKLADHFGITLHNLLFDLPDPRERPLNQSRAHDHEELFKGTFEILVRRIGP